jgi:hypothetical protein
MLSQVLVTNNQGDLLVLNLNQVNDNVIIENIEGLDPVKATLVSSTFSTLDGAQFQNSRREPRNIVLTLGLEPDWAVERVKDIRDHLYRFLMPKMKIDLKFLDDTTETGVDTNDISGVVESFQAKLFSAEPSVEVSIMCFDPDFVAHDITTVSEDTVSDSSTFAIDYEGTVEAGMLFTMNFNRTESEFTIKCTSPDGTVRTMDFSFAFLSGDVLEVSTVPGDKRVSLIRAGIKTPILYSLARLSKWIDLWPGSNYFNVYATGAAIPFTISYYNRFGGL